MENCTMKSPPVFTSEVLRWDRTTVADGNAMGVVIEDVFNNTVFNKATTEKLAGTILHGIQIPVASWTNRTYIFENAEITSESTVYVGYAFDSIPEAQKANIRGRAENGRLVLVAKKAPTQDLMVDEIRILNLGGGV